MPTFTPGDTVPPTALVSSSANINDDSLGTDITPAGWPDSGHATAVEVELTATDQFTADGQVQVGVSNPGSLDPISGLSDAGGTFSGADGEVRRYRTSDIDAYSLNKFGGWRTDYVTHNDSGATSNRINLTSTETPDGTGFDIRAKVRVSDWDGGANRVICSSSTSLGRYYNRLYLDGSDVEFRTTNAAESGLAAAWVVPQSSFSLTDGEWTWLRVTFTAGGDGRMYQSSDGTSWTLIDTITTPAWSAALDDELHIGATNQTSSGLDGDIAEVIAYDGAGDLIHDLALDAMEDDEDRNWDSAVGSAFDNLGAPGTSRATGDTIPATVRVRLDFDDWVLMDNWRLIVDAQTGDLTVDEIVLELNQRTYGWKVGML